MRAVAGAEARPAIQEIFFTAHQYLFPGCLFFEFWYHVEFHFEDLEKELNG